MHTKIILISGRAQSGKSSSEVMLRKKLPGKIQSFSFATPLKEFLCNVLSVPWAILNGTDDQKNMLTHIRWDTLPRHDESLMALKERFKVPAITEFMTGRQLMQYFGSDIIRKGFCPDAWASAALNSIKRTSVDYAIISDVRFPNELEVFKDYDPIVIRLTRNPLNQDHTSESALDNYDWSKFTNFYLIDNHDLTWEEKDKLLETKLAKLWTP